MFVVIFLLSEYYFVNEILDNMLNGMLEIEIKHRNELNQRDLDVINEIREKEFDSLRLYDKGFIELSFELWFLARMKAKIVAFGRLRTTSVQVKNEFYPIFIVQAVASVERSRGYGRSVMISMRDYVERHNIPAIGFCEHKNVGFYTKSEWNVEEEGESRFIFQYGFENFGSVSEDIGDAIWIGEKDHTVIQYLLDSEKEKIVCFRESW